MRVLLVLLFISWSSLCASAWFLTNVTVDDTGGDPVSGAQFYYEPAGFWSDVQNCTQSAGMVCPGTNLAYEHTWHAISSGDLASAEFSFTGSALYVYCILVQNITTDLIFIIDGDKAGTFIQPASASAAIQYDTLVYFNESLPWANHTFALVNGANLEEESMAVLDYVVYTTHVDVSDAAAPTVTVWRTSYNMDSQTRAIVAAVTVVGIVILAAVGGAVYYCRRHPYKGYRPPMDFFCKRGPVRTNVAGTASDDMHPDIWDESRVRPQRSNPSMTRGLLVPDLATRPHDPPTTVVGTGSSTSVNENTLQTTVEEKNSIAEATPPTLFPSRSAPLVPPTEAHGGVSTYTRHGAYPQTAHPPLVVAIPEGSMCNVVVEETSNTASSKSLPPLPPDGSSTHRAPKRSPPAQRRSTPSASVIPNPPTAFPSTPPSSRKSRRPKSEMAASVKRRSTANGTATPSTDRRASGMNSSDRTTPSTPHSMAPSGFWMDNTSTSDLPARADSVKTVSTMPMTGRHCDRLLGSVYIDTTPLPDMTSFPIRTNTDKSSDTMSPSPGTAWTTNSSTMSNSRSMSPAAMIHALEPVPLVDTRTLVESPASLPNSPSVPLLAASLQVVTSAQMARRSAYSDSAVPVGPLRAPLRDDAVAEVPALPSADPEDTALSATAVSMVVSAPSEDGVQPVSDTLRPSSSESSRDTDFREEIVAEPQPDAAKTARDRSPSPLQAPLVPSSVDIAHEDQLESLPQAGYAIPTLVLQPESAAPPMGVSVARQEGERTRKLPAVPLLFPSRLDTLHEDVASPRFVRPLPRPHPHPESDRVTSASSTTTISTYSVDNAELAVGERMNIPSLLGHPLQVVSPQPSAPIQLVAPRQADLLGQWPSDSSDASSLSSRPVVLTRENSASSAGTSLPPNRLPDTNIPKFWSRPSVDRSESSQGSSAPAAEHPSPQRALPLIPNRHPGVVLGTMLLPGEGDAEPSSQDLLSRQSSVRTNNTNPLLPNRHPTMSAPTGPRWLPTDATGERTVAPSQTQGKPARRFGL